MAKTELVASVYDGVESELKQQLIWLSAEINNRLEDAEHNWFEAIERLHGAHELLAKAGREGLFTSWVESETHLSRKTAYRMLAVNDLRTNCVTLTQLTHKEAARVDRTAWYELAEAKEPPQSAIKTIVKLAKDGVKVTAAKVKELTKRKEPASTRRATDRTEDKGNKDGTEDAAAGGQDDAGGGDNSEGVPFPPLVTQQDTISDLMSTCRQHAEQIQLIAERSNEVKPNQTQFDRIMHAAGTIVVCTVQWK